MWEGFSETCDLQEEDLGDHGAEGLRCMMKEVG